MDLTSNRAIFKLLSVKLPEGIFAFPPDPSVAAPQAVMLSRNRWGAGNGIRESFGILSRPNLGL